MPARPKRPCRQPGCPETHRNPNGYCDEHQARAKSYDDERPSAASRLYDRRWREARIRYLAENPLCVKCLAKGRTEASNQVDHIIRHKGDSRLFWDRKNWQALCDACHSRKTATEDGGFGNRRTA